MSAGARPLSPNAGERGANVCRAVIIIGGLLLMQPFAAFSQSDAGKDLVDLLNAAEARRARQLEAIELYVKRANSGEIPGVQKIENAGKCVSFANCNVIQVNTYTKSDGSIGTYEQVLSPLEVSILAGVNPGSVLFDQLGQGFNEAQKQINEGFLEMAGGDVGLAIPLPDFINPFQMFGMAGRMMLGAANATEDAQTSLNNSAQTAQAEGTAISAAKAQMEFSGFENIQNINAATFRLRSGFEFPQPEWTDQGFEITDARVWVDPERLTELKNRFEGKMTAEGETRDIFIEVEYSDFRNPAGCGEMIEPFRRTMRMGGMMDPAQMAQVEQARAQLAEFDKQMASMPAQQREMMQRMMGPQMDMVRNMASGGTFEMVDLTEEVLCNPDLASLFNPGTATAAGGTVPFIGENLVQQAQRYLVALGYMPGNTDGVLDTLTQIAISQFQAENGLEVTGEVTPQLVGILAAAADRL